MPKGCSSTGVPHSAQTPLPRGPRAEDEAPVTCRTVEGIAWLADVEDPYLLDVGVARHERPRVTHVWSWTRAGASRLEPPERGDWEQESADRDDDGGSPA